MLMHQFVKELYVTPNTSTMVSVVLEAELRIKQAIMKGVSKGLWARMNAANCFDAMRGPAIVCICCVTGDSIL